MEKIDFSIHKVRFDGSNDERGVLIASSEKGIVWVAIESSDESTAGCHSGNGVSELIEELREYFKGVCVVENPKDLHYHVCEILEGMRGGVVPVDLRGTEFQKNVWRRLQQTRAGDRLTYSELASGLGMATGVRAVARAVALNHIAVLVPCHRVVPKSEGVGQFRWGSALKKLLLDREQDE